MAAKKKETNVPPTFEDSLRRLESIVEKLEEGDVPLDDAMKLYEDGIAVSRLCAERLAKAELTLKRLSKDAEGSFTLRDEKE
jgi:exodeoxyribonuclease VII small subunit